MCRISPSWWRRAPPGRFSLMAGGLGEPIADRAAPLDGRGTSRHNLEGVLRGALTAACPRLTRRDSSALARRARDLLRARAGRAHLRDLALSGARGAGHARV